MERAMELDAAAIALERRRASWQERGWTVGPATWADAQYGGPYPYDPADWLKTDRTAVRGEYSLGVAVRHIGQEGELILYVGGWCDLRYWSGSDDEPIEEAPGSDVPLGLQAFEAVLDRFEALFTHR